MACCSSLFSVAGIEFHNQNQLEGKKETLSHPTTPRSHNLSLREVRSGNKQVPEAGTMEEAAPSVVSRVTSSCFSYTTQDCLPRGCAPTAS